MRPVEFHEDIEGFTSRIRLISNYLQMIWRSSVDPRWHYNRIEHLNYDVNTREVMSFDRGNHITMSASKPESVGAPGSELDPFSIPRAGSSSWSSAEDAIEAFYEFLLNSEYSTVKVILDRSIFLLAVRFEGVLQVLDLPFEGIDLDFSLGHPGLYTNLFCIRRHVR